MNTSNIEHRVYDRQIDMFVRRGDEWTFFVSSRAYPSCVKARLAISAMYEIPYENTKAHFATYSAKVKANTRLKLSKKKKKAKQK